MTTFTHESSGNTSSLTHVLSPITVGTLALHHRLVVPPHGGGGGSLIGTDDEFETYAALWSGRR